MFKFLLQTIDKRVRHDFVFEMEHALDYQQWRGENMYSILCDIEDISNLHTQIPDIKEFIPIETIEFVSSFIDNYIKQDGMKYISPLNVPDDLFKFTGRNIGNFNLTDDNSRINMFHQLGLEKNDEIFVKSNSTIKHPINGKYFQKEILNNTYIDNGNYQVSKIINIVSEYRCFIYNDRLVGIQYYSGNFENFPNIDTIYEMLNVYKYDYGNGHAPQVFTLDVAVTKENQTVVMEVHEFFSCGLYGFNDYTVLPYMFQRTFNNIKRRLTNMKQRNN